MCEAFAKTGFDVTLIRPFYFDRPDKDIYSFYGVEPVFRMMTLPTLLSLSKPARDESLFGKLKIPFIGGLTMLAATDFFILSRLLRGRLRQPTVVYSRNVNAAVVFMNRKKVLLRRSPITIYFEAHSLSQQPESFFRKALMQSDGLVSITHALKNELQTRYGLDDQKIIVCPDGVQDARLAQPPLSRPKARAVLHLDEDDKKLICYTGQLLPGKGAEVLLQAAHYFDENVLFYIVGGTPKQIDPLRRFASANVRFVGFVEPHRVPLYQSAADILVLPNTPHGDISSYTSPLKLFEYMAAARPIVASDQPVLMEILRDGENAVLFRSGDPSSLADGIRKVLADERLAARMTTQARKQVEGYSWLNRARRIDEFMRDVRR